MKDGGWFALLLVVGALNSCAAMSARAAEAPATLNLHQVKLVEFARLVWSEVLREDYIFDAAFLAESSEITVDVRALPAEEARRLVVETAKASGFVVEKLGRVWRFGRPHPVTAAESELFFYRPKYRSVAYLSDLLGTLFPMGSFSFQRGSTAPGGVFGMPGLNPGSVPAAGPTARSDGTQGPPVWQSPPGVAPGRPMLAADGARSAAAGGPYLPGVGVSSGAPGQVDARLDAFIFRGSAREVERLVKLLAQVDVPTGELVVRAVVYEVRRSTTDAAALTVAATLLNGQVGIAYGGPVYGNSLTVSAGGFKAVVSAFASDARFKAVSSPTLRVQSGQSARFTVGDETPVLGNVSYTQTGQAVQSVEYRPSGVIFELKPLVRDELVELDVKQQLSSFVVTTSGVNNSPTLLKRELQTVLGVKPGETIVIGGLEDARSSEDRQGVAFLPRWLDSRGRSEDRTEVLLVLDVQRVGLNAAGPVVEPQGLLSP